ncbi:hypothetical protein C882_3532 [Caenispirillum salinarum AK4]|uniref:ABC-type Fe3+ transport system protein n=1 Tax=Caenispirillum salinarum AK4 TaxID=1238182 RepID=K9HU58_9PROT|nr:DUF3341 domain-containing protein [Caenispirillum salinarum]EKV31781.1 hypothetical protein C882_3532 [Caenispirillum salinarum AK4]
MSDRFGMAARFDTEHAALDAVRRAVEAGWRVDAYTPYPVPGMAAALRHRDPWPFGALTVGAAAGFAAAMALQVYAVAVSYPHNIGGRDLIAWVPFTMPAFEMAVLSGVFWGIAAMLWRNRLPRLHHPVFNYPEHDRAGQDAFVVCVEDTGEDFDAAAVRECLVRAGGHMVREVPR